MSQLKASNTEDAATDSEVEDGHAARVVQTVPLTPLSGDDDAPEDVVRLDNDEARDESDSEEDMIKGVYFEDEAGRFVELG